ncbi:MAG: universal stress protein [Thermodesulfobacteriota bacterium]
MKIMYCHDGSERGQASLDKALDIFKCDRPDVILLCVAEDVLDASLVDDAISEEYESEQKAVMRKAAERVAGAGLEVDVIMATGEPRQMIMEAIAKQSPDIVIVARREKSAIFHKSVSAYLVKNAGCHLFIMGPS